EHRPKHPVLNQPGNEKIEALEGMEARCAVRAKPVGGQYDDRGDPPDPGYVAEDGCCARSHPRERIGLRWSGARLARAAAAAERIRHAHLISALAAIRHPLVPTSF